MAADTPTDDILTNISTCSYAFESTRKKVMPKCTQKETKQVFPKTQVVPKLPCSLTVLLMAWQCYLRMKYSVHVTTAANTPYLNSYLLFSCLTVVLYKDKTKGTASDPVYFTLSSSNQYRIRQNFRILFQIRAEEFHTPRQPFNILDR